MTSVQETFGNDVRRLRLDTLIFLRWIAIAGQTAALVFVTIQTHHVQSQYEFRQDHE